MCQVCNDNPPTTEPIREYESPEKQRMNALGRDQIERAAAREKEAYLEGQAAMGKAYATASTFDAPARPRLQERVAMQLHRAEDEARNAERLRELQYLLDKHPDVARILDLTEIVRG